MCSIPLPLPTLKANVASSFLAPKKGKREVQEATVPSTLMLKK